MKKAISVIRRIAFQSLALPVFVILYMTMNVLQPQPAATTQASVPIIGPMPGETAVYDTVPAPSPAPAAPEQPEETGPGYTWAQYRVFMRLPDANRVSNYAALLREVVNPLVVQLRPSIKRFYFLRYAGKYGDQADETAQVPLPFAAGDWVNYIKLRLLIDSSRKELVSATLTDLAGKSSACLGVEVPLQQYDVEADLGVRFGGSRTGQVLDLLQSATELALTYASDGQPYDPDPRAGGGTRGLVHLVSNTLAYEVDSLMMDWDRVNLYGVYP